MRTLIAEALAHAEKYDFRRENRFFPKNRRFFVEKKTEDRGLSRGKTPFFPQVNALFLENRFRMGSAIFATFCDRETRVRTLDGAK